MPFWCLDAKGEESLGFCVVVELRMCVCGLFIVSFSQTLFSSFALFWFVPVRPGSSSYGVRHMLPYPLLSMSIKYFGNCELHAYPVILFAHSYSYASELYMFHYLLLMLSDYKI